MLQQAQKPYFKFLIFQLFCHYHLLVLESFFFGVTSWFAACQRWPKPFWLQRCSFVCGRGKARNLQAFLYWNQTCHSHDILGLLLPKYFWIPFSIKMMWVCFELKRAVPGSREINYSNRWIILHLSYHVLIALDHIWHNILTETCTLLEGSLKHDGTLQLIITRPIYVW